MSTHESEERALEVMRKELASERPPELPWDQMERDLMARLDDAPITSLPRSLDAHVDDVPNSYVRDQRAQFVRIGFVVLAAAASFAIFWFSPLHSGKSMVISTASSPVATESPHVAAPPVFPEVPTANTVQAPQPLPSVAVEPPTRTMTADDAKAAFLKCLELDKHYGKAAADKLEGEKLTVFLGPDGRMTSIGFAPATDSKAMACFRDDLRAGKFVGATKSITIQF
jgi:hypothetical protein